MRDNKYKLMELFLYVIIVIIGLCFLLFNKTGQTPGGGAESPPVIETIDAERSEPFAVLPDEQ